MPSDCRCAESASVWLLGPSSNVSESCLFAIGVTGGVTQFTLGDVPQKPSSLPPETASAALDSPVQLLSGAPSLFEHAKSAAPSAKKRTDRQRTLIRNPSGAKPRPGVVRPDLADSTRARCRVRHISVSTHLPC